MFLDGPSNHTRQPSDRLVNLVTVGTWLSPLNISGSPSVPPRLGWKISLNCGTLAPNCTQLHPIAESQGQWHGIVQTKRAVTARGTQTHTLYTFASSRSLRAAKPVHPNSAALALPAVPVCGPEIGSRPAPVCGWMASSALCVPPPACCFSQPRIAALLWPKSRSCPPQTPLLLPAAAPGAYPT